MATNTLNDTSLMSYVYEYSKYEDIVFSVFYQISGVVAVLGNIFVMWVIFTTRSLHTPYNILLFNLAFIDHVTGIMLIIASSFYSANQLLEFYDVSKGVGTCLILSLFNLFFVGFDRFLTLTFPLKYMNIPDRSKVIVLVAIIWLCGAMSCYGVYGGFDAIAIECPLYDKPVGSMAVEIIVCGVVILTVLIHTRVYFIAAKQARRIAESQVEGRKQANTVNIKAIKTTLIVLGAFLFCYFPSMMYVYSTYDCSPFGGENTAMVSCFLYAISFSGCTVNPVIYTMRRPEFKKHIIRLFRKCGLCKSRSTECLTVAEMSMSKTAATAVLVEE
ncbi:trace amine-associated receptor 1-like [Antedon mediterranea]|uniref:trace amine-associated receptor 1-like n=1 Tax=Antedon mediterranea TaxID=105859 RepID=UPI003AF792B6